jgi:RNA polymerase sigma factor (sigma-70 family)
LVTGAGNRRSLCLEGRDVLHEDQRTTSTSSGEALTELYRLYAAEAFRFAVHLTGRKEDAEDVLQQVFLQAHRHLESGTELVNPRAWLMIAVKHRVFNLQRARRETPIAEIEQGSDHGAPIDEAQELTAVRGILWTLPEKQHQAFVLRYWSGLSQWEIAQVLGTTASAVESLLVRARTTLISERASGSEECERVRLRLVEGGQLSDRNQDHLRTCSRCRTGHLRLSRVAEYASVVALAPGLHVAHGLAALVPGFSAPAAGLSIVSGSSAAGASTAAGTSTIAGTSTLAGTSTAATAATASGKLAMAVKVALAVAATSAAATAVPPIHSELDRTLFPHHITAAAAAAPHRPASVGPKTGFVGAGPGLAQPSTDVAPATPGSHGQHNGTGAGSSGHAGASGSPAGQGSGKAREQGSGNAGGQGNRSASGQGNGNTKGQGTGKAKSQGNGNARGKAKGGPHGKARGAAGGNANGKAKGAPNGTATGAANGSANGQATGTSNGGGNSGANGAAHGSASSAAPGSASGAANGSGSGKAKGNPIVTP